MNSIVNFTEDDLIWRKRGLPNPINEQEDIILVVREDIIVIGAKMIGYVILFLILLLIRLFIPLFEVPLVTASYALLMNICISIGIVGFAYTFHNYYLSLQIVTTKRLIDIDQTGLFNREVNELAVEKIEDVTYKQNGLFPTLFGFGTVSVQTAAEIKPSGEEAFSGGFVFENVPQPARIHAIITDIYHTYSEREQRESARLNAYYMHQFPTQDATNTHDTIRDTTRERLDALKHRKS